MVFPIDNKGLNQTFKLEDREYLRLSNFIMSQFGIKLPPNKKILLQCRLQKRLKHLNHTSFREYVDYVFSAKGMQEEMSNMIDAVSTNKTDFFREPIHFDFLLNQGISDYIKETGRNQLSIWSAGCSSGEEPFTIAMVMKEYGLNNRSSFDFSILATDISTSVLEIASIGIYNEEKTRDIPMDYKRKYLLKGKNDYKKKVRVNPEMRNKIEFRKFNLLTTEYHPLGKFDIIFCRNVLIYFERDVQHRLLRQFASVLNPGGLLFLGHSESIAGYSLPLKHIKPTIFTKI